MGDRPKIHIFLGAPAPSSVPEECPPARWKQLELSWRDGRLRPTSVTEEKDGRGSPSDQTTVVRGSPEQEAGNSEADAAGDDESRSKNEDECSASVQEYLDSCFPAAQPEPQLPHCSGQGSPPAAAPRLSIQTQYLSTWTLSQALVLKARCGGQSAASPEKTPPPKTPPPKTPPKTPQSPTSVSSSTPELFSPATPSPRGSFELFSPPCSSVEEGGVVLEATSGGVLCSQEAERRVAKVAAAAADDASPDPSPALKKARVSEDARSEAIATTAAAGGGPRHPTTLLLRCDKAGVRYSVLVAVVHPCHLKEVKVRSGPSAGSFIPLASLVVTDQSGVEVKVVLWRRSAFWALTVSPGDVLFITGLQVNVDRWRGETMLQSTFSSKLLNLGQITASASPPAPRQFDGRALSCLCGFLRERRPLLVSLQSRPPQDLSRLPYATLRSLRVNTLVHALLRVTHTHISREWRDEAESRCRSVVQLQAVVSVEQPGGQQGVLLLWGAALDWLPRLKKSKSSVWEVRFLLVREGPTTDNRPELHSTPWSSVHLLEATDRRAQEFLRPQRAKTGTSSTLELDLDTLMSQKYSGDVELRVQVVAFRFREAPSSQEEPQPPLDSAAPLSAILDALAGDITYTGCGRCSAELDTDANGIYKPCYPCLPNTAVRCYYRPAVLTVRGQGSSQLCVYVPSVPLQKILEAPPDKLHKSSAPGSELKHIQVAAERIRSLLCLPRKTFLLTLRSFFLCDENSVAITQEFTLLDLQPQPH